MGGVTRSQDRIVPPEGTDDDVEVVRDTERDKHKRGIVKGVSRCDIE